MTKNIFQVLEESDLNEIIEDHPRNLVLVMFSLKTCAPCMSIRPKFISLANENPDCFFVYIDVPKFNSETDKYKVEETPTFTFYFNGKIVGNIVGAQEESLVATLNHIKMIIEEMKREAQAQAQVLAQQGAAQQIPLNPTSEVSRETMSLHSEVQENSLAQQNQTMEAHAPVEVSIEHKLDILKRLYDLSQHGVQLSKNYGIDSDYREMVWEYNMHVSNIRQQQENAQALQHQQLRQNVSDQTQVVAVPQNSEAVMSQESELEKQQKELINQQLLQLKKQEQIRKVQELNKLNYAIQTDQIYKLQQLKNMQRIRENAEKHGSNNKDGDNEKSEDSDTNNRRYRTRN